MKQKNLAHNNQRFLAILWLFAFVMLACATSSHAAIPPSESTVVAPAAILPVEKKPLFNGDTVSAIVPTSMAATNDQELIQKNIADQTLNSLVSGQFFRGTSIQTFIEKVDKATKPEISIKSQSTTPGEKPVEHKFGIQYLPQQEIAKLNYSGYVESTFSYGAADENITVDALRKLNDHERVGVNYSTNFQSTTESGPARSARFTYAVDF